MHTDTLDLEKERIRCKIETWLARGARRPESIPPRHSQAARLPGRAPYTMGDFVEDIWAWIILVAWVFLALGLVGCGGPDGEEDPWCETHRCEWVDLAFDPDPELEEATARAAARLDAATGDGFVIDAYGIPVKLMPQTWDGDGNEACGHAQLVYQAGRVGALLSIEIHVASAPSFGLDLCMSAESTIVHEAIHAFSLRSQHVPVGLFSPRGSLDEKLNGASLDELCKIGCWNRRDER